MLINGLEFGRVGFNRETLGLMERAEPGDLLRLAELSLVAGGMEATAARAVIESGGLPWPHEAGFRQIVEAATGRGGFFGEVSVAPPAPSSSDPV